MSNIRPSGPCPAKIMVVVDFPSERDVTSGSVMSDYAGTEFGKMLQEAGLMRGICFTTCFLHDRPPGNDIGSFIAMKRADVSPRHIAVRDKQALPLVRDAINRLSREIELCQPNIIIALGNASLWALTGNWGVSNWRGSVLQTDLSLAMTYQPKVIPTHSIAAIFRNWEWRNVAVSDLRRAAKEAKTPELFTPHYNFLTRVDYSTALTVLQRLTAQVKQGPLKLSVDLETAHGHIEMTGIAWSKTDAICIPWLRDGSVEPYWSQLEEIELQWALYKLLTHPNAVVVGQNFAYDAQYTNRHVLYSPRLVRDTMLTAHVMFSSMEKSLAYLASLWCEHYVYWKDELHGEDRQTYNCKDCVITYEVDENQQPAIDKLGLREVHDFQQRLFWPVLETMIRGIRPNLAKKGEFAMQLIEEIAAREQWLIDVTGRPVNIKSPKQMTDLFYEELGQKQVLGRKTGNPSCDDESLRVIAEREPVLRPLCNKISELRSLGVFLSTFVNAPLDVDGRIRCSFNIGGTETYRFSSSKNAFGSGLNLQNIPKGGGSDGLELPNVRSLFIPDPGMTFFDIDLAAADLKIVVWEADEPEFKAMLKEGADAYTEIAKEFYHDRTIKKNDPRRQTFKSFAHGTNYLGSAKGLAERLGLSVADAEKTQKWYFSRFPRIKAWQEYIKDQVLRRKMVENIFGYRTQFLGRIEGTVFNQAVAWIPQSTVACLINKAYVKIADTLPEVQVLLQVHDSLAGQFPTAKADYYTKAIIDAAQIALPYANDPLTIEVGCKTSTVSWGECG